MPTCPGCQRDVAPEDAFCRHCGTALHPGASTQRRAFLEQMAADFQGRLKDHPADTNALYNIGLAQYYAGEYQVAVGYFQRVAELSPDYAENWGKLALCSWHLGDREQACELMARAVALAPRDRRLGELLARMKRHHAED